VQNGLGEKRGRVSLNQLNGRKVGGRYGARKAEIGGAFQKERGSAGVERSRISRGFGKQRKDRGASGRVLRCLTVRATGTRNSIFIQQCRRVFPSPLALPFLIALACLCTVHLFLCWQPNEVRSGGRNPGVSGPGAGLGQSPARSCSPCSVRSHFSFFLSWGSKTQPNH